MKEKQLIKIGKWLNEKGYDVEGTGSFACA